MVMIFPALAVAREKFSFTEESLESALKHLTWRFDLSPDLEVITCPDLEVNLSGERGRGCSSGHGHWRMRLLAPLSSR